MEKGKVDKNISIEENFFDDTPPIKMINPPEFRIAIVGTREFNDYSILKDIMTSLFSGINIVEIISGGAKGVDTLAKRYAEEKDIPLKEFLPAWDNIDRKGAIVKVNRWGKKYDAGAGFRRNQLIIERANVILAIWNGKSKGTKSSIDIAVKLRKNLSVYDYEKDTMTSTILNVYVENYIKQLRKDL